MSLVKISAVTVLPYQGSIPARGKKRASSLTCQHRPWDSPSRVLLPGVQQRADSNSRCSHTAAPWPAQGQF